MARENPKYLNVRLPESLSELVDEAVAAANVGVPEKLKQDRSAWVREALEASATRELASAERPDPCVPDGLGGGFRLVPGRCVHPFTARVRTPQFEACGLCGRKLTWLT